MLSPSWFDQITEASCAGSIERTVSHTEEPIDLVERSALEPIVIVVAYSCWWVILRFAPALKVAILVAVLTKSQVHRKHPLDMAQTCAKPENFLYKLFF